jgi:hypothetical protein
VEEAIALLNLDFGSRLHVVRPPSHLETGRFNKWGLLVGPIEASGSSIDKPHLDWTMDWFLRAYRPVTPMRTGGLPDYKTQTRSWC